MNRCTLKLVVDPQEKGTIISNTLKREIVWIIRNVSFIYMKILVEFACFVFGYSFTTSTIVVLPSSFYVNVAVYIVLSRVVLDIHW
jgi:hypothetical protein